MLVSLKRVDQYLNEEEEIDDDKSSLLTSYHESDDPPSFSNATLSWTKPEANDTQFQLRDIDRGGSVQAKTDALPLAPVADTTGAHGVECPANSISLVREELPMSHRQPGFKMQPSGITFSSEVHLMRRGIGKL